MLCVVAQSSQPFATLWSMAHQAPLPTGILQTLGYKEQNKFRAGSVRLPGVQGSGQPPHPQRLASPLLSAGSRNPAFALCARDCQGLLPASLRNLFQEVLQQGASPLIGQN